MVREPTVALMPSKSGKNGAVGYRRPPVETQFKPGRSGNPSGRPKMNPSLKDELFGELAESIRIHADGIEVEMSKARAVAKALVGAAVSGNMRALSVLVAFCSRSSSDVKEMQEQSAAPEDTKLFNDYIDREVRRRTNARDTNLDNSATDSPIVRNQSDE